MHSPSGPTGTEGMHDWPMPRMDFQSVQCRSRPPQPTQQSQSSSSPRGPEAAATFHLTVQCTHVISLAARHDTMHAENKKKLATTTTSKKNNDVTDCANQLVPANRHLSTKIICTHGPTGDRRLEHV